MKSSISYKEAKKIAQSLGLRTKAEYLNTDLPYGLVKNPVVKYGKEFEGWPIYLGKEVPDDEQIKAEVLEFFKTTYVTTMLDWGRLKHLGMLKNYFPRFLKDRFGQDFVDECLAASHGNISYEDLIAILVKHKVTTISEYHELCDSHLEYRLPRKAYTKFGVKWSDIKNDVLKQL